MKESVKHFDHELFLPSSLCDRTYSFLQLQNGLLCLLISDPLEELAGVSLSICSGAFKDPDSVPGLAHLCEHMLLLGSKNYPEINNLQKIITSTKYGQMNAFTTGELTNFYYQLNCLNNEFEVLDESLRNLIDFLQNPLFSNSLINKEIIAVDNEHTRNKTSISKLLFHGLRLLSSNEPNNKFRRFATGNFETLKSKGNSLQKLLIDYFEKYYGFDKAVLVIKSPQSINLIKKMVLSKFDNQAIEPFNSSLNDFQNSLKEYSNLPNPFGKRQLNKAIFIENNNDQFILRIVIPINYYHHDINESRKILLFCQIVVEIFGDESLKNGIFHDKLSNLRYINDLETFISDLFTDNLCIIINLSLTKLGFKKIKEIINIFWNIVFNTFLKFSNQEEFLKNNLSFSEYLSDLSSVELVNYLNFSKNLNPMEEVSNYSNNLQENLKLMGQKWLLRGNNSWIDLKNFPGFFKESLICQNWWDFKTLEFYEFVKQFLNLNNFNLVIYGKDLNSDLLINKTDSIRDPYYEFDYTFYKISIDEIDLCDDIEFEIPFLTNEFIPEFSKSYKEIYEKFQENFQTSLRTSLGFNNTKFNEILPKLFKKSSNYQIWYKEENSIKFHEKISVSFDITCTNIKKPTINQILSLQIFNEILKFRLLPALYQSEVLDFYWNVNCLEKNDFRIGVNLGGYNNKIMILLKKVLMELIDLRENLNIDEKHYFKGRLKIKEFFKGLSKKSSLEFANAGTVVLLEENSFNLDDYLKELEDHLIEDLTDCIDLFFNKSQNFLFLNLFIQGDVNCSIISKINEEINKLTNHMSCPSVRLDLSLLKSYYIKNGKNYYYEANSNDFTNCLVYFIQFGSKNNYKVRSFAKLLLSYLENDVIDELRTKKQLGYAILPSLRSYSSITGIQISIVSGTLKPKTLEIEVNKYFKNLVNNVFDNLDEDEFFEKVKIPFLKKYIKDDLIIDKKHKNKLEFYKNLNEKNLIYYLKNDFIENNKNQFEDFSTISKMKSGSNNDDDLPYNQHLNYWKEIISFNYNFKKIRDTYNIDLSDFEIDVIYVKNLTRKSFSSICQRKLLLNNKTFSKLSVWINKSNETKNGVGNFEDFMINAIESILKVNNLIIPKAELINIVKSNNFNKSLIFKKLLVYFLKNGESLKILSIILKSVLKGLNESFKSNKSSNYSEDEEIFNLEKISDIKKFQLDNPPF